MMDIKEWDVNLGVESRCRKYSIRRRLLSGSSGAGVNAVGFPLSELVWSPNDGLHTNCIVDVDEEAEADSSRNCFGEAGESCNSDKGKVHGSKRMKKEIDAAHGILPSFWITRLSTKGKEMADAHHIDTVTAQSIFDAIRNLQLTRADIHKWIHSNVPSSHLNGFFLRLRLGLRGTTTYYVACITGDPPKNDASISVDVGGIKSSVSTQYVSNHHFLQDEINAWWCTILDSSCKIPSLVELRSKFNDRKTLGF
ncbi:hypothetical protein C2S52_007673 [Perilla frutescens var. hirtella]|nr:hypothetical protein C2S52_007673 [Perilla frutescens var. hirtella]